jgi:hypothetical protein
MSPSINVICGLDDIISIVSNDCRYFIGQLPFGHQNLWDI